MNIVLSSSHSSLSAEDEHESHDEHGGEQSRIEHIIRELITTEEIYIRELGEVLNGYGKEIDSIPPNKNCPEILRGNRYIFVLETRRLKMAVKFFEIIFDPILTENQGPDRSTANLAEQRVMYFLIWLRLFK